MISFFLQNISITLAMSAVILLLLILSRLAGDKFTAKCRYVVWAVVMLRLAIPIGMGEGWLIQIELPAEEAVYEENTPAVPMQNDHLPADRISSDYTPSQSADVQYQPPEPVPAPEKNDFELPALTDVLRFLGIFYLVGAALYFSFRMFSHFAYTRSVKRWKTSVSETICAEYSALCDDLGIKRAPVLYSSARADSPMLCGYFRTLIILPENITETEQIRGILHHELTHYRRGDLWLKLVCLFAESLHWFNPLVHRASRRCEQEMELACDESVLSGMSADERVDYGCAMLEIVKQSHAKNSTLSAKYIGLTTHYSPKRTAVRERFENIVDTRRKKHGLYIMVLAVILCAAAGLAVSCQVDTGDVSEDETVDEMSDERENEISESSDTDYTDEPASTDPAEILQSCGLSPEESRYRFIMAFLTGDSATLEPMLGLDEGMGEVFKTLKFGDWSVKLDEDYEPNYEPFYEYMRPVDLTVEITESGISSLPVGEHTIRIYSDSYMYEIYLTISTAVRNQYLPPEERSDAYKALLKWLSVNETEIRLGNPENEDDNEIWCSDIGDYLGVNYGAMPLEDYERLAEICFGMTEFEPYIPLIKGNDGTYYVGGHGGTSLNMDFISETMNNDGTVSIVIKYYADHCGLIESELVEYILRDTGEVYNEIPVYAFEGMNVTPLSEFPPYVLIN